jgi:hypothetical protein
MSDNRTRVLILGGGFAGCLPRAPSNGSFVKVDASW